MMRGWGNPEQFYDEDRAARLAMMVAVLRVWKPIIEKAMSKPDQRFDGAFCDASH